MRRIEEEKITTAQIARQRKDISDSIMIDRQEHENLLKEIKGFNEVVKKQRAVLALGEEDIQKLLALIQNKQNKIIQLEKDISERTNQLDKITNELEAVKKLSRKIIENAEYEAKRIFQERVAEKEQLTTDIQKLKEVKEVLILEKDKLTDENKGLFDFFGVEQRNLELLKKQSEEARINFVSLKAEILNLVKDKENLEEFKRKNQDTEIKFLEAEKKTSAAEKLLNEIEKMIIAKRETFASIQQDSELALKELLKIRGDDLFAKNEAIIKTAAELQKKEKRVMELGNTLQKHLDKQNIPIKVF